MKIPRAVLNPKEIEKIADDKSSPTLAEQL